MRTTSLSVALAFALSSAAQAATLAATATGSTYTSYGYDAISIDIAWTWDEATASVTSLSLTLTDLDGAGGDGNFSYVSGPLTIAGSALFATSGGFEWDIDVTGAPVFGAVTGGTLDGFGLASLKMSGTGATPGVSGPYGADFAQISGANNIGFSWTNGSAFNGFLGPAQATGSVSAVPLPAGLPMLLAGAAALTVLRRPKRG